jgi:hypothetical protein
MRQPGAQYRRVVFALFASDWGRIAPPLPIAVVDQSEITGGCADIRSAAVYQEKSFVTQP